MSRNSRLLPYLLLATLAIIWGSSFMLMKIGLVALTPVQLAAFRLSVGGLVFLPFVYRHFKRLEKSDRKFVILAGLIGNGIPAFLFAIAQTKVDSSIAGALNALTPLFTLIIGALFTSMVLNKSKITGVVVGLIGAVAIVLGKAIHARITGEGEQLSFTGDDVIYSLLVVLATVLYGSNINLIKTKLAHYKAVVISTLPLFFMSIPSTLILAFSDWSNLEVVAQPQVYRSFGAIAILALLGNSLSLFLFNRLIQTSGPVFASSVTYFIPIVALLLGWFDNERILAIQFAGMLLILGGVYLLNRGRTK